ncbi:MAG: hypothetical protein KBT20_05195 [Bacteroidales bacterium]|nr:hypothetical protein [Candidatus Liminaster caballi]
MKKLILGIIIALLSVGVQAQKVKPVQYGGTCQYQATVDQASRVYTIRVTGYGKKDAQCREDAEVRVLRMVLYTGIDGKSAPLLKQETSALDDFIDNKQYKDYIQNVVSQGPLTKDKGAKSNKMTFDITIRINALDSYLRNNGYKKFGF